MVAAARAWKGTQAEFAAAYGIGQSTVSRWLGAAERREYTDEMLEALNAGIPAGRHARPDEVAALFAFLASEQAAYLTGISVNIDGGETA